MLSVRLDNDDDIDIVLKVYIFCANMFLICFSSCFKVDVVRCLRNTEIT